MRFACLAELLVDQDRKEKIRDLQRHVQQQDVQIQYLKDTIKSKEDAIQVPCAFFCCQDALAVLPHSRFHPGFCGSAALALGLDAKV